MKIRTLSSSDDLSELVRQSEVQGYRFVRRLVDEMTNGENRFDHQGEVLFVAEEDRRICGVCGLNIDDQSGRERTSRLRHLYIDPDCRGKGVGTQLVNECLEVARQHSDMIVLRTFCGDAAAFYRRLGFSESDLPGATHQKQLQPQSS